MFNYRSSLPESRPNAIHTKLLSLFYCFALMLSLSLTVAANNKPVALSGRVVDQYGIPVSGATITLKEQTTGKIENSVVDGEGKFLFSNTLAGEYQLSVVANGFVITNQQISLNGEVATNLVLTLPATRNENKPADGNNPATMAEEVQQLRSRLAETNQQIEKLSAIVQQLQVKLETNNNNATNPLPVTTASNTQPASPPLSGLFGRLGSKSTTTQDPNSKPLIDVLVPPKSAGGQFSGSEGLLKTDRVKIGGYGDFRFFTRGVDEGVEIEENVDEQNPDMTDVANFKRTGFTAPRLVLGIAAALTNNLVFNSEIEYEFAGEEIDVEQAYLEYRFNPAFNFRGGIVVPPLGRFNLFHDSNLQDISSRPLTSTFVIPSTYKDAGIGFLGSFNIGRRSKVGYEVYVVNGLRSDEGGEFAREAGLFESKDFNRFFDNNPQKSVVGRLMVSPIIGIETGFSGYRGKHDNKGQFDLSILAFDFKVARGGFQVLGEYARAATERAPEDASEIAARNFLLSLPKGDYVNTFEFLDANINNPIFDKPARSSDGFYIEARYRFRPQWFTSRTSEDGSIAPVFRYDQVNFDRQYPNFSFPLNRRRYSMGLSIRPTEAANFNFTYNFDRKPDLFLRLPDGRPFPPYFTNLGVNSFTFGMSYAF